MDKWYRYIDKKYIMARSKKKNRHHPKIDISVTPSTPLMLLFTRRQEYPSSPLA